MSVNRLQSQSLLGLVPQGPRDTVKARLPELQLPDSRLPTLPSGPRHPGLPVLPQTLRDPCCRHAPGQLGGFATTGTSARIAQAGPKLTSVACVTRTQRLCSRRVSRVLAWCACGLVRRHRSIPAIEWRCRGQRRLPAASHQRWLQALMSLAPSPHCHLCTRIVWMVLHGGNAVHVRFLPIAWSSCSHSSTPPHSCASDDASGHLAAIIVVAARKSSGGWISAPW